MRIFERRDGTSLDQELINTNKTANITYIKKQLQWYISKRLVEHV